MIPNKQTFAALFLATSLPLAGLQAANPVDFCSSPPPVGSDWACHGALVQGAGGLISYERDTGGQMVAVAQWINDSFGADGAELVLSESEMGPMWRPRVALLDNDTAFAVWSDGRARHNEESFEGFDLRGAVLRRGQSEAITSFVIQRGTPQRGVVEPEVFYDPASGRVFVQCWTANAETGAASVYAFTKEALIKSTTEAPMPLFITPASRFGALAVDRAHRLMRVGAAHGNPNTMRLELIGDNGAPLNSLLVDLSECLARVPGVDPVAAVEGGGKFTHALHHSGLAVGPTGEVAFVISVHIEWKAVGYVAGSIGSGGALRRIGWYAGPMPTEWNTDRPKVAFSGEDPVVFLPVLNNGAMSLLVAPLSDGEISTTTGTLHPLPNELAQFDVILLDHGKAGKAAVVASSGRGPARVCLWPEHLIGF